MKKYTKVMLLVLIMAYILTSNICAANIVPYADTGSGDFSDSISDSVLVGYTEFGWVTFQYRASYKERYSYTGNNLTLSSRETTWNVEPSRSNAPATLGTSPVVAHKNASGSQVNSYLMKDSLVTLWTGTKKNSGSVTYKADGGYTGHTGFFIGGSTVLYPFSESMMIRFALDS